MQNQPRHFHHAQARANATQTIKQLAEHGIALLREPAEAGGWSRPDWWAQIAGRQWSLLFADLARLVRRGTMPALIDGDAFWVISPDPNPFTAVPSLLSTQRWNGFAPGYEVPLFLSKKVQDLFRGKEPVDLIVKKLDSLSEENTPM
jgi:hypothetical protein